MIQMFLRHRQKARVLRKELMQQPIRIFIGRPFPRTMRMNEVYLCFQFSRYGLMGRKFFADVYGQRITGQRL